MTTLRIAVWLTIALLSGIACPERSEWVTTSTMTQPRWVSLASVLLLCGVAVGVDGVLGRRR